MDRELVLREAEDLSLTEIKHLISGLISIKEKKLQEQKVKDLEDAKNNLRPLLAELDWVVKFERDGSCHIVADVCNLDELSRVENLKHKFGLSERYICSETRLPSYKTTVGNMPVAVEGPKLRLNYDDDGINIWFLTPKLAYDYVKLMDLRVRANEMDLQRKLEPLQKFLDLARAWNSGKVG